jgi:hypothetical protein
MPGREEKESAERRAEDKKRGTESIRRQTSVCTIIRERNEGAEVVKH